MREQRKVVTVLFCDLVGSTALGESTDPEALRARATTGEDDLTNLLDLELLGGLLLARDGRFAEAEEAAGQAMQLLDGVDMNEMQAKANCHLAELFTLTGKRDAACEHGSRSIAIAERKGDVALAARLREWLAAADVEV